ncbi:unnamed protein product [Amoebophrya sp. A25]|nr:unnamed protein product [Amoebophrya sp. A25]|eukprot:GSA25T00024745001.1
MPIEQDIPTVLSWAAGLTGGIQLLGFIHGFTFQTEAFYDALGGINSLTFVVLAFILRGEELWGNPRQISISCLFAASRLWLLSFLAWRAKERGGDGRFDKLKPYFFTFLIVWFLQAVWVFCVGLPVLVLDGITESVPLNVGDYICIGLFTLGLLAQIHSDIVKAMWVKSGRAGGFCTRALWYWSRHPNYFGEILMWWCAWGLCVRPMLVGSNVAVYCALAVLSPLITTLLLLGVSGMPLAEGKALERYYTGKYREEYIAYRERTSPLIPVPTSLYKALPIAVKRIFFLEFKCYEYTPADSEGASGKRGRSPRGKSPRSGISSSGSSSNTVSLLKSRKPSTSSKRKSSSTGGRKSK